MLFDQDFSVMPDPDNSRQGYVKYMSAGDGNARIDVWCSRSWLGTNMPSSFTVSFAKEESVGSQANEFPLALIREGSSRSQYDSVSSGDDRDVSGVYVPVDSPGEPAAKRIWITVRNN
jgi:hypothetical protein